jgi:DNA-binding SARP family transcriptional activator
VRITMMKTLTGQTASAAITIEFRFFGTFAVCVDDRWCTGPPPKKGGEFLQFLGVYSRRVATRDELAAAFWPGLDLEDVEHRIHLAASGARVFLRRHFGGIDALQCVGSGYTWSPDVKILTDADRLIALTRRATIENAHAALALYGGDFLAGETADWLTPIRIRMASARACALEAIVDDLMTRKQYAVALSFGLELVDAERGHESGTRSVMRCFAALGQRTRAVEQYQRLRAYLMEQIGVEPTEETQRLAATIVDGRVA